MHTTSQVWEKKEKKGKCQIVKVYFENGKPIAERGQNPDGTYYLIIKIIS